MLPPGQREIGDFPRFGVPAYANRLASVTAAEPGLDVNGARMSPEALAALERVELKADFHCVTTWTRRGLAWSGFRLRDVLERAVRVEGARFLEVRCLDGFSCCLLLEDALADNVLLADRLDGAPLTPEHGAPLRLVAPDLYGYKNAKHVASLRETPEWRTGAAERQTLAHPRGRVAREERSRLLPAAVARWLYRSLLPATLAIYRRAARRPATLKPVPPARTA